MRQAVRIGDGSRDVEDVFARCRSLGRRSDGPLGRPGRRRRFRRGLRLWGYRLLGSFLRRLTCSLFRNLPGRFLRDLFGPLDALLRSRLRSALCGLLFLGPLGHGDILQVSRYEIVWESTIPNDAYRVASASIENTEKTNGFRSRL